MNDGDQWYCLTSGGARGCVALTASDPVTWFDVLTNSQYHVEPFGVGLDSAVASWLRPLLIGRRGFLLHRYAFDELGVETNNNVRHLESGGYIEIDLLLPGSQKDIGTG